MAYGYMACIIMFHARCWKRWLPWHNDTWGPRRDAPYMITYSYSRAVVNDDFYNMQAYNNGTCDTRQMVAHRGVRITIISWRHLILLLNTR